jgi:beta-phosphoglucomutase-like phosphatase (HAD superfamily)
MAEGNEISVAFLFDVDGVIVNSPHEISWRDAAIKWNIFSEDFNFHTFYQKYVAGMPGLTGAETILEMNSYFKKNKIISKQKKQQKAKEFREIKQRFLDKHIKNKNFKLFQDIVSIIKDARGKIPLSVVSSSENSKKLLEKIGLLNFFDSSTLGAIKYRAVNKESLYSFAFGKLCGKVKIPASVIPVVFEDADKGIIAAKNLGYLCIGIAREGLSTPSSLINKGADLAYDSQMLLKKGLSGLLEDLNKIIKR